MKYNCKFCNYLIEVDYPYIIHSGYNDTGFMYCNKSGDLITWNIYDDNYNKIAGNIAPWIEKFTQKMKTEIEDSVIDCPCGGKFIFTAKPRCPNCNIEIPDILPDSIQFVQLRNRIDGEKVNVWKKNFLL